MSSVPLMFPTRRLGLSQAIPSGLQRIGMLTQSRPLCETRSSRRLPRLILHSESPQSRTSLRSENILRPSQKPVQRPNPLQNAQKQRLESTDRRYLLP